jgi:hypothetical protein
MRYSPAGISKKTLANRVRGLDSNPVDLTIVADKTIYMSADAIRKSSTDLSMIGLASGTTYMCILHLVSSVPTNSTIDLYKLTAGNWTKITIVSFELTVRLSDI